MRKTKYACLTGEQQDRFDAMAPQQKAYVLYRAQGMGKTESYKMAGYKSKTCPGQNAYTLENRLKMQDIIEAMANQAQRGLAMKEGTSVSKEMDEKAAQDVPTEMDALFDKNYYDEEAIDTTSVSQMVAAMTPDEAANAAFYRKVANGQIRTRKVVSTYDADGKLTGRRVEETIDAGLRMQAQKEYSRILGVRTIVPLGEIRAQNITINIVDASKKKDMRDTRDEVQLTPDQFEVKEEKEQDGGQTENA